MTREEFEETVRDFGKEYGEEACCFEWGSHFSPKYREELFNNIMMEFDRLKKLAGEAESSSNE